MKLLKSFLGKGWSFPPEFDPDTGQTLMSEEEEDIRQSIRIILSTNPGERLMYPEFGCPLRELVFENMNLTRQTHARTLIETAILRYEPRVSLERVDFKLGEENPNVLHIYLEYLIRTTNTRSNMVYPFYLIEGTHINL